LLTRTPGLTAGSSPHDAPAAFAALQRAAKFLAIGGHLAGRGRADGRLQHQIDHLARKALEVLRVAQRPVDAGRGHSRRW
jgi:hypothetical protein